jgi:hypothetical protein
LTKAKRPTFFHRGRRTSLEPGQAGATVLTIVRAFGHGMRFSYRGDPWRTIGGACLNSLARMRRTGEIGTIIVQHNRR